MQFTQLSGQLYSYSDSSVTVYYLLPIGQSSPGPILFTDAWTKYTGVFIFLEHALKTTEIAGFITAAQSFLTAYRYARFAWFNTPYKYPLNGYVMQAAKNGNAFAVYQTTFPLGSMT